MYIGKSFARILFFIIGFTIVIGTLFYTSNLFNQLAKEEADEVKLFAKALRNIGKQEGTELNLYWDVLQMNSSVPILVYDAHNNLVQHKNIAFSSKELSYSKEEILRRKNISNAPIKIQIAKDKTQYIYYGYSPTLNKLRYMPFIQLILIILLLALGYILYRGIQQAYKNKIWAGLSKETAHQLGTPISSLMGWMQLLEAQKVAPDYLPEMTKDIERLKVVSDRFSNIGAIPYRKEQNILPLIQETINYMNSRTSESVKIYFEKENRAVNANINKELFNWVIENLIKNSVDAIVKKGIITIKVQKTDGKIYIDITDSGKGIPAKQLKKIFRTGHTTKKRGWGLGLSLTRRIIEHYHNGRIFVKNTEVGKGTTFRIVLPKA